MASFRGLKDENFNLEISNRQQEKSVKQGYWEWRSIRAWKMEWSREGYTAEIKTFYRLIIIRWK